MIAAAVAGKRFAAAGAPIATAERAPRCDEERETTTKNSRRSSTEFPIRMLRYLAVLPSRTSWRRLRSELSSANLVRIPRAPLRLCGGKGSLYDDTEFHRAAGD
jgi:hypothetical protein